MQWRSSGQSVLIIVTGHANPDRSVFSNFFVSWIWIFFTCILHGQLTLGLFYN
jgi:hypothetical protein